jgi:hypothetical protein
MATGRPLEQAGAQGGAALVAAEQAADAAV